MTANSLIKDLSDPKAYPHNPDRVELIETHISWVFLAGDLVYKLKKPVDFGFLDFSDLEKRKFFCGEEVRLNRRLAPEIYLGVEAVSRNEAGHYLIAGGGEPEEYAVEMKRMPDNGLMKSKLLKGEVDFAVMDRMAALLKDFYQAAETGPRVNHAGDIESIKHNTDEDFWQTTPFIGQALSGQRFDHIRAYTDDFLEAGADLFHRRIEGGFIRDCHGDLHMGNICLDGDRIWIFDCIEFNEKYRFSDVASDLAFLSMDLDFHGRRDLGRRLIDTYVSLTGDRELLEILNFYKCYRAYVRGKIGCFTFDQHGADEKRKKDALHQARRYFDLAYTYAGGKHRPVILAFAGLMGTGKSHWAREAGEIIGAQVIGSDRMRKQMAGFSSDTRVYVPFGQGLYSPEVTENVYKLLHGRAEELAGAGLDAVVDASYMKNSHRRGLLEMAARTGAELTFILVTADEDIIIKRLKKREARGRSLSDGRREIYASQAHAFEPWGDISPARTVTLSTNGTFEETREKLTQLIRNL